jgi:hypothetical protein
MIVSNNPDRKGNAASVTGRGINKVKEIANFINAGLF